MTPGVRLALEVLIAALLVASGFLSLAAGLGLLRLKTFFMRMHPPAIANTFGVWSVALAAILYFALFEGRLALYLWLIPIFLSITAPVTTALLARAALFRERQRGGDVPPAPGDAEL